MMYVAFLSFFLPSLVEPLLPTRCRSGELLLDLITFNDTHSVGLPWTMDQPVSDAST